MAILYVGIDLAKSVLAVHGVDEPGKPVLVRPAVRRAALVAPAATLAPCVVAGRAVRIWGRIGAPRVPPTSNKAVCRSAVCSLSRRIVIALHVR